MTKKEKIDLQNEYEEFLNSCGSCISFNHFHASAGICNKDKCEGKCACQQPMVDMFDEKCDVWVLDPKTVECYKDILD